MVFAVVKFSKTNDVAVVPTNWMRGEKCLWPPKHMEAQIAPHIAKNIIAAETWNEYPVETLGVYGSYQEARLKLRKAEEQSDLNTTESDDCGRGKRKKYKRKFSTSSIDSDETTVSDSGNFSLEEIPNLELFQSENLIIPNTEKSPKKNFVRLAKTSKSRESPPQSDGCSFTLSTEEDLALVDKNSVQPIKTFQRRDSPTELSCSFTLSTEKDMVNAKKNSDPLLNKISHSQLVQESASNNSGPLLNTSPAQSAKDSVLFKNILREINIIKANQKYMMETLDAMAKSSESSKTFLQDESLNLIDDVIDLLPLATDSNFLKTNNRLNDEASFNQMVLYLSRIGGVNVEQGIKLMLKRLATDDLAQSFSLMGLRGKNSFKLTNLYKVIMCKK